jgi:hypothetical protein
MLMMVIALSLGLLVKFLVTAPPFSYTRKKHRLRKPDASLVMWALQLTISEL